MTVWLGSVKSDPCSTVLT